MNKNPFVLTIMDGWGHNPNPANNAVAQAHKPNFDRLWAEFPHTFIRTDGTLSSAYRRGRWATAKSAT